jgi:hypothetical protein
MEIATVGGLMGALVDPVRVHLDSSQNLTDSIPDPIYEAAHEPFGARALLYAILLNDEVSVRECQMQQLRDYADPMVFIETQKLIPVIDTLDPLWRLPVVDLAIPALRELIPTQFHVFRKNIDLLIECDQAVSLREYALKKVLTRHLDPVFSRQAPLPGKKYTTLPPSSSTSNASWLPSPIRRPIPMKRRVRPSPQAPASLKSISINSTCPITAGAA